MTESVTGQQRVTQLLATSATTVAAAAQGHEVIRQASLGRDLVQLNHRLGSVSQALVEMPAQKSSARIGVIAAESNIDLLKSCRGMDSAPERVRKAVGYKGAVLNEERIVKQQGYLVKHQAEVTLLDRQHESLKAEHGALTRSKGQVARQLASPSRNVPAAAVAGLGLAFHGYQAFQAFSDGQTFLGASNTMAAAGNGLIVCAALAPKAATVGKVGLALAIGGIVLSTAGQALRD